MVKGRMLNVIKYLEKHRETGYRQIAEAMDETTRAIRYDIDKINDELLLRNYKVFFKIRANTSSRKLRATGTVCLPTIIRLPSIISIFSKFIRYDLWTC